MCSFATNVRSKTGSADSSELKHCILATRRFGQTDGEISDPFQDPFRVQNHAKQGRYAIKNPIKTLVFDRIGHVDIVEVVGSSPISSIGFLMVSIAGPNGALNQAGWTDQMILSFTDSDDSLTPLLTAHNLYGLAVTNEIGIQDVHCGNSDVDE